MYQKHVREHDLHLHCPSNFPVRSDAPLGSSDTSRSIIQHSRKAEEQVHSPFFPSPAGTAGVLDSPAHNPGEWDALWGQCPPFNQGGWAVAWFCLPRGTGQDKKAKGKLGREGESHLLRNFHLNLTKGKGGEEGEEKNCATCPLVAPLLISTLTIHQPCSEALS